MVAAVPSVTTSANLSPFFVKVEKALPGAFLLCDKPCACQDSLALA